MLIVLNGQSTEVPAGDLGQVLSHVLAPQSSNQNPDRTVDQAPCQGIAVAVNGEVVPRSSHAAHQLQPGDVVDVVSAVPGG